MPSSRSSAVSRGGVAERVEYVASVRGANAYGNPVFRVVDLAGQVCYVTVPYKRSTHAEVDATITRALLALRRKPKPVR